MAVSLSPIGGVGAQFFDNNGVPLSGGKLYSYEGGTTTPKTTYTSYAGTVANTNPIILNSAGRIPEEVWLTTGEVYKFVLTDSIGNQLGTWDNIYGYSTGSLDANTEVQTATAGQTVFVLSTMAYSPGTFTLGVYVDGVNQVVNNAYVETNATTVTFTAGLHEGATVKFININIGSTDASVVTYEPGAVGSVATTVQAKLRESVSVKDFGAVGDGVTDDLPALAASSAAASVIDLVGSETYNTNSAQEGWELESNRTLIGNGQAVLKATTLNYRPLQIDTATTSPTDVHIKDVVLENNASSTDDWAPVRFGGAQQSTFHGNHTRLAFYGSTYSYSINNDRTEIRTKDFSAVGNLMQGAGSGYEIFSIKNGAFTGNVAYKTGTQATQHGFRVTGYGAAQPAPGTDLKTFGVAFAGNSVNNYANGISQQLGVYGCAYAGMSFTQCVNGIQLTTNDTSADDQAKGNTYAGIAMHNVTNGIRAEKTEKHVFSGLAIRSANYYGIGMLVTSSTSTYGTGKYNRFDGGIYDHGASNAPLWFEGSNSRIDLTIADINASAANAAVITGDYNVVTITGGGYASAVNNFLRITGDNNIVTIAVSDVAQPFQEIQITGNNNVLICNLDISDGGGEVYIASGTGNQIIGHCNITTPVPAGNRIDGVFYAQAQGITTSTTDGSGDVTISYGYTITGLVASQSVLVSQETASGGTPRFLQVHSKNTSGCKVRVFDTAGAAVSGASVTVAWKVTAT